MATHTRILQRKWARYEACAVCEVLPGDPCRRKIPQRWHYRGNAHVLINAHKGRPKSHHRCGHTGGNTLRTNSTFACHLVPNHGGEVHRNWHGIEWPNQEAEAEVAA
jgi:hypothetical protein